MRSIQEASGPNKGKAAGRTPSGSSISRPTKDLAHNPKRTEQSRSSAHGRGREKKQDAHASGAATKAFTSLKLDWLDQVHSDLALAASHLRVAFYLAQRMNAGTGNCYPSQDTIADACGITTKQVANAVAVLRASGHLTVMVSRGRGRSNVYAWRFLPQENQNHSSGFMDASEGQKLEVTDTENPNCGSPQHLLEHLYKGEGLRLPPRDQFKETGSDARETIERALEARSISHEPEYPDAPEWLGDGDWEIDFEPDDLHDDDRQPFRWADPGDELDASHSPVPRTATLSPIAAAFACKLPPQLRDRLRVEQGCLAIPDLEDPEAVWLAMGGPAFVERQMREGLNPTELKAADDIERIRDLVGAAVYLLGPDHPRADAFDRLSALIGRPIERTDPRHPLSMDFLPF